MVAAITGLAFTAGAIQQAGAADGMAAVTATDGMRGFYGGSGGLRYVE